MKAIASSQGCIAKRIGISALVAALIASAYLMALTLGSPDLRWLGWVTLLPLFLSIRVLSPGWAWLAGTLWGACLCLFTYSGGVLIAPSVGSFALLAMIPGAYAFLGCLLTRRVGFSPFLLALGWLGVELALQPLSLSRGLLASTQGDGLIVRTLGSLAGYFFVAFAVAYVNATLLTILDDAYAIVCSSSRIALRSAGLPQRWFRTESPSYLLVPVLPSQPRAPPL